MSILRNFIFALTLFIAASAHSDAAAQEPQHLIYFIVEGSESAARLLEAEANDDAPRLWSEEAMEYRTNTFLYRLTQLPREQRRAPLVVANTDFDILYQNRADLLPEAISGLYGSANVRFGCSDMGILTERLVEDIARRTTSEDHVSVVYLTPGISSPQAMCTPVEGVTVDPIVLPQPVDTWSLAELADLPQVRWLEIWGVHDDQLDGLQHEIDAMTAQRGSGPDFYAKVHPVLPTIHWVEQRDGRLLSRE